MTLLRSMTLDFSLPDWRDIDFQTFKRSAEKAQILTTRVGSSSDKFRQTCSFLGKSLLAGTPLETLVISPLSVRAFFYLLSNNERFYSEVIVTSAIITAIRKVKIPLSTLSLSYLIQAYLKHYSTLRSGHSFGMIRELILESIQAKKQSSEYSKLCQYQYLIFGPDAPEKMVNNAVKQLWDLDVAYEKVGIAHFSRGQFYDECAKLFYLETLKDIPVGTHHAVLEEIKKSSVHNSLYKQDLLLGHEALKIIIRRSSINEISEHWRSTLLTIAGDPRVPQSAPSFQKWWAHLPQEMVAKVRGWLSRFDLDLFLQALEQAAKEGGNRDVERMFLPRKHFLQGLLKQGLILESRLFLGRKASSFLQRSFKASEMPKYLKLKSADTSVIYLNLGNVHLVEGSHSFTLKAMTKIPQQSPLASYQDTPVADRDFRVLLESQFYQEFLGKGERLKSIKHTHLHWQNQTIEFLREEGLHVTPSKMMSSQDYYDYRYRFGV